MGAVTPEALEVVEVLFVIVLDVHDDVAEVEQHPATGAVALAAQRLDAGLLAQGVLCLLYTSDAADE